MDQNNEFKQAISERFQKLPKVVQQAIVSADISKHLRELADTQKLHVDQWEDLENEVQMTLLGIQPAEELAKNIKKGVRVSDEVAETLAGAISSVVFAPIREALERELEHPDAVAAKTSDVEDMRTQMLAENTHNTPAVAVQAPVVTAVPTVIPGTPPPAAPTIQVERAPVSPAYQPASASHERKTIDDDPYREQLG